MMTIGNGRNPPGLGRRRFLACCLGLGASGIAGRRFAATAVAAEPAPPRMGPGTIDVHHHFFPPVFKEASDRFLQRAFGEVPRAIRDWSPAAALEALDRNGVAQAVLSSSSRPPEPGTPPEVFRGQARQANEFGARMIQDHPKRFAQFGFLPMPDVEGSLREIAYAMDVLKSPGIGLMTSYGNRWLGSKDFAPVLEELNRRSAVVFCHPLPAACCTSLMPNEAPREALLLEFPYDTGRAVVSLLMSGSFTRYSKIRWIFCHCGDTIPPLSGRMRNIFNGMKPEEVAKFAPNGVDHELQRQFYDTADGAYAPSMAALQAYVGPSQIIFGTDYPYVSVDDNVRELHERRLPDAVMQAIQRSNVVRLMPQLDL